MLEPLHSIVEDIHLWARSPATGLARTRVGSEILCGCEVGAHEGRIMASGYSRVLTFRLRFVRFGRKATKHVRTLLDRFWL